MKLFYIIAALLTFSNIGFLMFKRQQKKNKEKEIYNGKTEKEFLSSFIRDWKEEYFQAMRKYLDIDDGIDKEWIDKIIDNASKFNRTYAVQLEREIDHQWEMIAKNSAPSFNYNNEKWRRDWIKNTLLSYGLDPENEYLLTKIKTLRK